MKSNSILNKAKYSENTDEWYTDYETVESEVSHYSEQFCDKIVLCNCDDPYESAFSKYFLKNFNVLKLKKLICTSYKGSRIVDNLKLYDDRKEALDKEAAYVMEIETIPYNYGIIGDQDIIKYIQDDRKKLYLANTNPAVDNMRRKVNAGDCYFKTITKFLSKRNSDTECDILFIDECSTVSNKDMREVLEKATFKLLVLVGDVFQIESILFGNWFSIARTFVPETSVFELSKPYRSNNERLLTIWDRVRKLEDDILEPMVKGKYTVKLDESIFEHSEKDEIIVFEKGPFVSFANLLP